MTTGLNHGLSIFPLMEQGSEICFCGMKKNMFKKGKGTYISILKQEKSGSKNILLVILVSFLWKSNSNIAHTKKQTLKTSKKWLYILW